MKKIVVIGLILTMAIVALNGVFARPSHQVPEMQVGMMFDKFAYAIERQGSNFTQTSMFYLDEYEEGEIFEYGPDFIFGRMLDWEDINSPPLAEGVVYIVAVRCARDDDSISMDPEKVMWSEYYAYEVDEFGRCEFICHVRGHSGEK